MQLAKRVWPLAGRAPLALPYQNSRFARKFRCFVPRMNINSILSSRSISLSLKRDKNLGGEEFANHRGAGILIPSLFQGTNF